MQTLNSTTVFDSSICVAFGRSLLCGSPTSDESLLGLFRHSYSLAIEFRSRNICLLSVLLHFCV